MTFEEVQHRLKDLAIECGFSPLVVVGQTFDLDGLDFWMLTVSPPTQLAVCFIKIYDAEADELRIEFSSTPIPLARRFEQTKDYAVLLMRRNGEQRNGFWRFVRVPHESQQFVMLEDLATLNAKKFHNAALAVVTEDRWWQHVLARRARTWAEESWE